MGNVIQSVVNGIVLALDHIFGGLSMVVYTKVSTYFNVENKLSYEYYYATFATIVYYKVFLHFLYFSYAM